MNALQQGRPAPPCRNASRCGERGRESSAGHNRTGFAVRVPAGRFDNCLEVEETTPLEPDDISQKTHRRGVGLVKDEDLELTAIYGSPRPDDD